MRCLRLGPFMRFVAFKATLLLSVNPFSQALSMPMQYKTMANTHKVTPSETHIALVGEIT